MQTRQKKPKDKNPKCKEYYAKLNPTWTAEECEQAANKFNRERNFLCIEYYQKKFPDLSADEQQKILKQTIENKRANHPGNLDYYKAKYPNLSLEEQEKLFHEYTKKNNFQCLEYYKKRFPNATEEEQKEMLANAIKNYTAKRDESGEKNGMHRSRTSEYKRRSISPRCIEFYERKFPNLSHEEHEKKLAEYFEYNKSKIKAAIKDTNIEFYLNQGMSYDEATVALKNRQSTFSLEKCIKKYGEEKGKQIYENRQQKWLKSLYQSFTENGDGRSMQSAFAKDIIKKCCNHLNIDFPKKEKYMYYNGKAYAYDFCYKNKIIEFNGDYWHANPTLYDEHFYNKVKQMYANEIWEYDKNKKIAAEAHGYEILYIWEYDYTNDSDHEINKCIEFLNETPS